MKNIFAKIKERANKAVISVNTKIAEKKGETYVDTGVKILIAVVIGALVLTSLYLMFNSTIIPTAKTKIEGLFNYNGAAS